jgi:hypothetical protein
MVTGDNVNEPRTSYRGANRCRTSEYRRAAGYTGQSYRVQSAETGEACIRANCLCCDIRPLGNSRGEAYNPTGFCVGPYGGCHCIDSRVGSYSDYCRIELHAG